ncbi:MAG: VOC family protein, partial [SAR202 cluster bacterium]|nr:VOC family protein [SAR202 cluster bacterium]
MNYAFNHVHLKSSDPKKTADWYVKAFNFKIVSDAVRIYGDRFIACDTVDGRRVNISAARTGEKLGKGDYKAHIGIEHFGITV